MPASILPGQDSNQASVAANPPFFGDNCKRLRGPKFFPDIRVDLVYPDPPINSNTKDNVLLREAFLAAAARTE
jgi:hypothetical protein